MVRKPSWSLFAAAVLVLGAVPVSLAITPPDQSMQQYEIPLPGVYNPYQLHDVQGNDVAAQALETTAASRLGGNWQVSMNSLTETPHWLLGSGIETGADLSTDASASDAALGFISSHRDLLGASASDLRLSGVRRALGKVAVHFEQTYHGIPVSDGRVQLTYTDRGRLFAMSSDFYRDIDVNPTPSLSLERATEIATAAVGFDPATDEIDGHGSLVVLPIPYSDTEVAYRLVWRVRVRTQDPLGVWVTHVDAHSGEIHWRYNDLHFAFSGDATGPIHPDTYCNGSETQPFAYLRVDVTGQGTVVTNQNGQWSTLGGAGTATVSCDLEGPYVDLNNNAAGAPEAFYSGQATSGVPHHIVFDAGNSQGDERDVFDAVNDMHDFFQEIDPGWGYANQSISAYVSRNDGYCPGNAWWDGTINFCAAGGQYANTGEIQGVVHHEFGHGVQNAHLGSQGNEGLGEGNSDVLANIMTQESIIGRGFFTGNCTGGIRDSDNNLQYPEDLNGSVHHDGQIIAGFQWDLMVTLQDQYGPDPGTLLAGSLWHFARKLEQPFNQPDQVIANFIADDDDGNLDNGTPNYDAICGAATNHGFAPYCPEILVGVIITHTPVEDRDTPGSVNVVATIVSTESALALNTLRVSYQLNGGGFLNVPMTPTGQDQYQGTIPDLTVPTEVGYYIYAEDMLGNVGTSPRTAPVELHQFDVANLYDPQEVANNWTVNVEGTDNATTGIWVRVDPVPTGAQPGDDHTVSGTMCWITGNNHPTGGLGEDDVDGGTTTLYTTNYNLSGATNAKIKYWRWYSNNQGSTPNTDTWVVQIRNNAGSWFDVERNQSNQNDWYRVSFDAYAQFGVFMGDVQLKFVASDLGSGSVVEGGIDDLVVLAGLGTPVDVEIDGAPVGVPPADYMAGARPNPFNPRTTVRYGVTSRSDVQLSIFDVHGRLVRALVNTTQDAGNYAIVWDGVDDLGRAVGSGTYYARIEAGQFRSVEKLTLLK